MHLLQSFVIHFLFCFNGAFSCCLGLFIPSLLQIYTGGQFHTLSQSVGGFFFIPDILQTYTMKATLHMTFQHDLQSVRTQSLDNETHLFSYTISVSLDAKCIVSPSPHVYWLYPYLSLRIQEREKERDGEREGLVLKKRMEFKKCH